VALGAVARSAKVAHSLALIRVGIHEICFRVGCWIMLTPSLLANQVAIVTGGGTGIGLAIATRLGELGARLVVASRSAGNLEAGTAALRHAGFDPLAVQVDVRNPEQVDEMVERTVRHFGRIDILVNNAAGNFICRAEDLSPNGWNAVIGIVLNGSFYCSRAVGLHMIARAGGGAIVSILANYVWTGSAGTIHSAAAKAGVLSMTQTLAVEWARHRIRVNAVAPGPIESPGAARQLWNTPEAVQRITDMVPLGRWGQPKEVADAVAFLVSEHAGYITGETLTIDGGAWLGRGTFGFL
jgi:NAD(P)-dependent dehydrogenase (short-subunit alcohol dehydrogenase family)